MPLPRDVSDTDLVARIGRGDHAALDALLDRHADAVHDHVARFSGDATLAADATAAAFVELLDDITGGTTPSAVLPVLLRSARHHALAALATDDAPGPAIAPAVLAAAGPGGPAPRDADHAWRHAAALGAPLFSVLDLHVRHGLSGHDLGAVLGLPTDTVEELLAALAERTDGTVRDAYAGLTTVPAPVAARAAVVSAAATRLGRRGPTFAALRDRAALAIGGLALLVIAVGTASALGERSGTPAAGPATAAAEVVPSPSPVATPSVTPTLEPRPSPSVVPMASPEPTVPVSPSPDPLPTPSPTPAPTPSPTPEVLAVTIDTPAPGTTFDATQQDGERQVASVPVAATVSGASPDTTVTWSSSLAPDDVLLTGEAGDVVLWLQEPCVDTTHTLLVTVRDEPSDQTAQASVEVVARETCEDPVDVTIDAPADGSRVDAQPTGDGAHRVEVAVAATAEGDDLQWTWGATSGRIEAAPDGPSGTLVVILDECTLEEDVTITVDVVRPADEAAADDRVTITANCPIG